MVRGLSKVVGLASLASLAGLAGLASRARLAGPALALGAVAGCAGTPAGDSGAVDDSVDALSSKTTASLTAFEAKNWVTTSAIAEDGDILSLHLYADGTYVRLRCYGAGCSEAVAETDRVTAHHANGKTYLDFWSFLRQPVAPPPAKAAAAGGVLPKPASTGPSYQNEPVIADTYEIRATASGIKLRKAHKTRWVSLASVDDATLCDASGGTWSAPSTPSPASGCGCPSGESYVAGAGGCMHVAVSTEDACDQSNGSYTDDDATRLGTFCACGLRRTMTDTGCVDL
ncbi:MAG: hypothetical protein NVS3B10_12990 [Polyangiales bacterium]